MPGDRLDTWKAIAAHVGRDVRTVLRWHKYRGLPVHRVPGGKGRNVFAYVDELDAWLQGAAREVSADAGPDRASPYALAVRAGAGALLLALLAVGSLRVAPGTAPSAPARIGIENKALVAFDAANREVWRVPLPDDAALTFRGAVFADLDGDGSREILAPVTFSQLSRKPANALYCITATGRVLWSRSIDDSVRFGAGEYGPPWSSADVAVVRRGAATAIAYAVTHSVWWPSIVALLDTRGEITGRFIHAGWITRLETAADGRTLLAGGVSNARDASILAVLHDDAAFAGAWPETVPEFQCACAPARLSKYFVFPRSEASQAAGRLALRESIEVRADGSVLVRVPQRSDLAADALYEFTPSFELRRAAFADLYWDWHRQLEGSGLLDHHRGECGSPVPAITAAASPAS